MVSCSVPARICLCGSVQGRRFQLTKVNQLLASAGVGSLLKVRAQAGEDGVGEGGRALGDAVALIGSLGAVGGMVLAIELVQLVEEFRGHAVLMVQLDGALDRGITDNVAMCQVLGDDARARLFLLCNFVRVTFGVGGNMCVGFVRAGACCGCHADVRGAQLGVVQEEGGLGSSVLFYIAVSFVRDALLNPT